MDDLKETYTAVLYNLRTKYARTRKQRISWLVAGVALILVPISLALFANLAWVTHFFVGAAIVLGLVAIAISYNRGSSETPRRTGAGHTRTAR
jgi:hypothetical protein